MQQTAATTSAKYSAQQTKRIAVSLPDALRDALGQIIAAERREWRRDREIVEAHHRAELAEARASYEARIAEFCAETAARVDAMVAERLATLKDGRDGVDGAPGKDGVPGRDGVDGKDGAPGKDGRDGVDGAPGKDGAPGRDGIDGKDGRDGADGAPGSDGERGPEGPPGKLPMVREWGDAVHYEGAVVSHDGAMWQAMRDTGRAPPHDDWRCVVAAGRAGADGRSMIVRGTWGETEAYRALDVVALNGAAFVARRDDPGVCPGDGWQMIAAQGKRGIPGEPGRIGPRGERGEAGPALVAMDIDEAGMVTATNADGTIINLDMYPLLSRLPRG